MYEKSRTALKQLLKKEEKLKTQIEAAQKAAKEEEEKAKKALEIGWSILEICEDVEIPVFTEFLKNNTEIVSGIRYKNKEKKGDK